MTVRASTLNMSVNQTNADYRVLVGLTDTNIKGTTNVRNATKATMETALNTHS